MAGHADSTSLLTSGRGGARQCTIAPRVPVHLQAKWLEDQLMLAKLVDPEDGKVYRVDDLEEDVLHIMRVMVWMERGIFERVVRALVLFDPRTSCVATLTAKGWGARVGSHLRAAAPPTGRCGTDELSR